MGGQLSSRNSAGETATGKAGLTPSTTRVYRSPQFRTGLLLTSDVSRLESPAFWRGSTLWLPKVAGASVAVVAGVAAVLLAIYFGFRPSQPASESHDLPEPTSSAAGSLSTSFTSPTTAPTPLPPSAPPSLPPLPPYIYTAAQPGPGCDAAGGSWTEKDVQLTSGCAVEPTTAARFGYLDLALPGGKQFQQDNSISITGSLGTEGSGNDFVCVGLDEEGRGGGYLATYCNDGSWHLYAAVDQVPTTELQSGSLPMPPTGIYTIYLSFKGTTLSLVFNNNDSAELFLNTSATISPISPTIVGVAYEYANHPQSISASNFSYTAAA
jgi:hypothetical protein